MWRPSGLGRVVNWSIVFVLTCVPILMPVASRAFSESWGMTIFSSDPASSSSCSAILLIPNSPIRCFEPFPCPENVI